MEKLAFFNRIALPLFLILGLAVTACNPDEIDAIAEEDLAIAELDAMVEANFEEVNQIGYEIMDEAYGRRYRANALINSCVAVTRDTVNRILTLDFGTGCVGPDGKTRSGIITVDYTKRLWWPGASLTINLDNFYIDGTHVQGTLSHQNLATSFSDTISIQTQLIGGQITSPDGSVATREYDRTRTWLRGLNPATDQLLVEGSATGTRKDGSSYSATITSPKIYRRSCLRQGIGMAVEGTVVIQRSGKDDVEVDYGSSDCDKEFVITVNGQSRTINR